jgi:hypothetical protein
MSIEPTNSKRSKDRANIGISIKPIWIEVHLWGTEEYLNSMVWVRINVSRTTSERSTGEADEDEVLE